MDGQTLRTGAGYLVATFLTTVGLSTIINPVGRTQMFGVAARPVDKAMLSYVRPLGARDLSLGLTIGALMYQEEQRSAGSVALIALMNPAMDAWAVWKYNRRLKEAWGHIFGVGIVGGLGVWLIGS